MLSKIKNSIEHELARYIRDLDSIYSLNKISPLLFKNIRDFVSRKGKRIRPTFLVIGYLGFKNKAAPHLYRSAISLELLHDFLLVHDDIIDKSPTRRGEPSMHEVFNKYLIRHKNIKFSGQDLAIVIGDVMYALGINAFLSIKANALCKEAALRKLIDAAMYTASGEFIELLYGLKSIDKIAKSDIYKIYDYKTAYYTFATPLAMGAILAGARRNQVDRLFQYGIYLGRAFQIKDDIIGMFSGEKQIGKSTLTDLREAKKTILIWHAYNHSPKKDKIAIKTIFSKQHADKDDLLRMRKVIVSSGALDYAKGEISNFLKQSQGILASSKMQPRYKDLLYKYSTQILNL